MSIIRKVMSHGKWKVMSRDITVIKTLVAAVERDSDTEECGNEKNHT